ncbi:MAG: hypothetical protein L6Q71_06790, partial [Planctomycetes bacterium]|nr:hypothetical protein [Planctomycetota bacterium]
LDASETSIDDAGLYQVGKLKSLRRLTLNFSDWWPFEELTSEGLKHLARLEKLESLDVRGIEGVDAGIIQTLSELTNLKELHIANSRISPQMWEAVGKLTALEQLQVKYMTDKDWSGMPDPSPLSGLEKLRELRIGGRAWSAAATLASLSKNVQCIDFSEAEQGGPDGSNLVELAELKNLRTLVLRKIWVGNYGMEPVDALRAALPTCNVIIVD